MRRTNIKTKRNHNILMEEYKSVNEFITITDSRKLTDWANRYLEDNETAREATDNGWRGGSWEQSRELLIHGWDEKVEEIKRTIKNLEKQQTISKMSFRNDVVGYAPIVPNAIIGIPQSMINNIRVPKKSKVIKVLIDLGTSWKVDSDQIIKYGAELLKKIYSLEKSGFRIKLEYMKCFNDEYGKKTYTLRLPLKNENQPFDLKRMAYPIAHTMMFRRTAFDWYERLEGSEYISGYGKSLSVLDKEEREDIINALSSNDTYVITYGTDLEEAFKEVR